MLPLVVGSASRRKQKFLQFSKSKPFGDITFTPLDLQSFEHDSVDAWHQMTSGVFLTGVGWGGILQQKRRKMKAIVLIPGRNQVRRLSLLVQAQTLSSTYGTYSSTHMCTHACRNPQTQKLNHALGSESSRVSIFFVPQISVILMLPMGQTLKWPSNIILQGN